MITRDAFDRYVIRLAKIAIAAGVSAIGALIYCLWSNFV